MKRNVTEKGPETHSLSLFVLWYSRRAHSGRRWMWMCAATCEAGGLEAWSLPGSTCSLLGECWKAPWGSRVSGPEHTAAPSSLLNRTDSATYLRNTEILHCVDIFLFKCQCVVFIGQEACLCSVSLKGNDLWFTTGWASNIDFSHLFGCSQVSMCFNSWIQPWIHHKSIRNTGSWGLDCYF